MKNTEERTVPVNQVGERVRNYIEARTIRIDGKTYLPVDEHTIRRMMIEVTAEKDDYNDYDDFRSRA